MPKLPLMAAEHLLEIIMRPLRAGHHAVYLEPSVEDWGKLLGNVAAESAVLDRLLHHGHVLKGSPRSWRTNAVSPRQGR